MDGQEEIITILQRWSPNLRGHDRTRKVPNEEFENQYRVGRNKHRSDRHDILHERSKLEKNFGSVKLKILHF